MKNSNLSSRASVQKKVEFEIINGIEQGIKRRLLEKYKPKNICSMETMFDKKNDNKVA